MKTTMPLGSGSARKDTIAGESSGSARNNYSGYAYGRAPGGIFMLGYDTAHRSDGEATGYGTKHKRGYGDGRAVGNAR